jgi:hypothetical protein
VGIEDFLWCHVRAGLWGASNFCEKSGKFVTVDEFDLVLTRQFGGGGAELRRSDVDGSLSAMVRSAHSDEQLEVA